MRSSTWPAGPAIAGLTAPGPSSDLLARFPRPAASSDLLARIPGPAASPDWLARIPGPAESTAAWPGLPVAGTGSAASADRNTSQMGFHQSASQAGSHLSSSRPGITGSGSVGGPSPGNMFLVGLPQPPSSSIPFPSPWLSGTAEHTSPARINRYHRLHPMYYGPQWPDPRAAIGRCFICTPLHAPRSSAQRTSGLAAPRISTLWRAASAAAPADQGAQDSSRCAYHGTDPAPEIVT